MDGGRLEALGGLPEQLDQLRLPHGQVEHDIFDRPIAHHAGLLELLVAQPVDGLEKGLTLVFQCIQDLIFGHSSV